MDLIAFCGVLLADNGVVPGEENTHDSGSNRVNLANSQTGSDTVRLQGPLVHMRDTSESAPACPAPEPVADSDPMREDSNSAHASPSSEPMAESGPTSTWITVPGAAGSASLDPVTTNARFLAQPPGLGLGDTKTLSDRMEIR